MYGSSYVIDHCYTERDKERERANLEYYVTDTLHLMGMNIASMTQGKYIASSWRDLCHGTAEEQDRRTGDEIAEDVMLKAGLSFGGDA